MLENIVTALTLVFSLLGLLSTIYYITLKMLSPKKYKDCFLILPLYDDNESIMTVCGAIEKRNLLGEKDCAIIAVDMGLSFETFKYLERMCLVNNNIWLISKEEIASFVSEKLQI